VGGKVAMSTRADERRRFDRYEVNGGILFSDNNDLIGVACVVDISQGGVRCVSLSQLKCPINWLYGIELYDCRHDLAVSELQGRMVRCTDNLSEDNKGSTPYCYDFGFEFFSPHTCHLADFKKIHQSTE